MDDNTKLNERLSVADLRMYEGKKDGKDLSTSLSKIIIARDIDTSFDVLNSEEYPVYASVYGNLIPGCNMASDELKLGELFCVVEKDLDMSEDIIEYMMDSKDFYFHRLKYAQERFNLYAKSDVSSFTLPMLSKYRKIVKKDEEKMRTFNMLVTSRRQKLIRKRERENSNAYVKTTNQY